MSRCVSASSSAARRRPAALADLKKLVPKSDTVQASPRLAAHFVDYERVYPLHVHPEPLPQWIIVDGNDKFAGESAMRDMHAYVMRVVNDRLYVMVVNEGGIMVLRRDESVPGP